MNINLLEDRLLVKPIEHKFTKGGLVLPDSAKQDAKSVFNMVEGIVVLTGPGRPTSTGERMKMSIGEGDLVYYPAHLAGPIEIEDEKFVILNEPVVIAYTKRADWKKEDVDGFELEQNPN